MRDSENDVRRRVREGDREAFALLYEQFARAVYNHGLRLTGDWSTAEEIMSETFLTAWRTRERVQEDGGSLLPWLLGIATHKADNARRGVRRRQLFLARQPQPRVEEDFAPRTIGRIDDARYLRAVQTALGRLRRQEREVLALCVWSGLDYQQTAEALGAGAGPTFPQRSVTRLRERGAEREALRTPGTFMYSAVLGRLGVAGAVVGGADTGQE